MHGGLLRPTAASRPRDLPEGLDCGAPRLNRSLPGRTAGVSAAVALPTSRPSNRSPCRSSWTRCCWAGWSGTSTKMPPDLRTRVRPPSRQLSEVERFCAGWNSRGATGGRPGSAHGRGQGPRPQVLQRGTGVLKGVGGHVGADGHLRGQGEELLAVGARQVGHRAQDPLAPEVRVRKGWDVAHVDSAAHDRAALSDRSQRRRHELAGRREDERRVQRLGWRRPPHRPPRWRRASERTVECHGRRVA